MNSFQDQPPFKQNPEFMNGCAQRGGRAGIEKGVHHSLAKAESANNRLSGPLLWLAVWIIGAWLISRSCRTREKAFSGLKEQAGRPRPIQTSSTRVKRSGSGPGILSLAFDLIGTVAIRIAQRYAKSWSSGLMTEVKTSSDVATSRASLTVRESDASAESSHAPRG